MALYNEAALILTTTSDSGGSLKSRIYKSTDLKSNPSHLFALISESSKWSPVLKEVIENSGLLPLERKVRVLGLVCSSMWVLLTDRKCL